jgi:hypothetical protein
VHEVNFLPRVHPSDSNRRNYSVMGRLPVIRDTRVSDVCGFGPKEMLTSGLLVRGDTTSNRNILRINGRMYRAKQSWHHGGI